MLVPEVVINTPPLFHRCEPGWSWHPAPLPDYDFWFVLEGHGEMQWQWQGQSFTLQSGVCFIFPPGAQPRATHDPRRRLLVFAVHFSFVQGNDISKHFRQGEIVRDRAVLENLAARCERNFRQHQGRASSELTLRQMIQILHEEAMQPERSSVDSAIEQIITAIRAEPGASWRIEELAQQAHLSTSQFTRRFRQITHMSPAHFVIHTRLQRACELLQETEMSLSQIAHALGYIDPAFFARQFKSRIGCTPGAMRRRE
jgi:AraC-like DNA-binding protein